MINYEIFSRIKQYREQGFKSGQIANKLFIDQRTVKIWSERQQYRQRKLLKRKSKLDSFKDYIVFLIEKHP